MKIDLRAAALAVVLGGVVGTAAAAFSAALHLTTSTFVREPRLLALLPAIGALQVWAYRRYLPGDTGTAGALSTMRGGPPVGRRTAPAIVLATLLTHLGGGSAGREGTAIGMGVSLSELFRRFAPSEADRARLAAIGGAAGFAGLFGTPFAAIALVGEVTRHRNALFPAAIGAFVADTVARRLGLGHPSLPIPNFRPVDLFFAAGLGLLLGLVALGYAAAVRTIRRGVDRVGPVAGATIAGTLVALAAIPLGTRHHGLSLELLNDAWRGAADPFAWLAKAALTAVTIGGGFRGGEVTPLFAIGATFGIAYAGTVGAVSTVMAAAGTVALFGAGTRLPLTAVVLAAELFGLPALPTGAISTGIAWWIVTRTWPAQRDTGSEPSVRGEEAKQR